MTQQDQAIRRFRKRLAALLFLRRALHFLAVYFFLWGVGVVVLRVTLGMSQLPLLWGLAGLPLALLPAAWLLRRQLPATAALRPLFDERGRCGGLLMASTEVPLGGWEQTLPLVSPPRLLWDGRRSASLCATAAAFLLACLLLPDSLTNPPGQGLDVSREASKLSRKIEVLKEEAILDTVRADALKKKLDQVRDEAMGRNPSKTWEALDHLKDMAARAAQTAAEAAARKNGEMARTEAAADALQKAGPSMAPEKMTAALAGLGKLLEKATEENDLLAKELKELKISNEEVGDKFDLENLPPLSQALKGARQGLKGRLGRLCKECLLTAEDLKKCNCEGECDMEALVRLLCENKECSLKECLARCQRPGRGGVTEDEPSDTDLTFGDESSKDGVKWKEQALPPPALKALKDSRLTQVSRAEPKKENGGPAGSGALAGAAAGGGSANTPVVLPRHRGPVERYFERPPLRQK
jgi:hypothetical protein